VRIEPLDRVLVRHGVRVSPRVTTCHGTGGEVISLLPEEVRGFACACVCVVCAAAAVAATTTTTTTTTHYDYYYYNSSSD